MKRSTKALIIGSIALVTIGGVAQAGYKWSKGRHMVVDYLQMLDKNQDKAISKAELDGEIDTRFKAADSNNDQQVTKPEMVAALDSLEELSFLSRRSGSIADRFVYRFDLNEDGNVTKEEIDNRLGKMFALADRNDDGKVEMEEVKRLRGMHRKGGRSGHGRWHHRGTGE